ncbi:transporter [Thalassorhabdus alkalitolerans]|uniref:Transporter n=1 Tax=Thalassorhabdus alkalitolerans TaxID=2282697 RepID=A0ABW0YR93_9BACI
MSPFYVNSHYSHGDGYEYTSDLLNTSQMQEQYADHDRQFIPPFGPPRPPFGPPGPPFGPPGPPGAPTSPPPAFTPSPPAEIGVFAVDPGAIRRCLFRYTYVWLTNRQQFWFYPVFVGRTSIAGYRWTGFFWVYFGIDLRRISSFQCF